MADIERPSSPTLEAKDLRVALALASAGSTAAAASALSLTQPAVSRALISLEDKLGVRLFERTAKGLSPSPAGERLLEGAARLLHELQALEHRVCVPPALPTRLRIVCECYTGYHWLPSVLATLRSTLPDIHLTIAVEHTRDPVAALVDGSIDAALITTSAVPRAHIEERPLFHDEVVFVVGAGHPLANKKSLTPGDLRGSKLLTSAAPPSEVSWFNRRVFGRNRPRLDVDIYPLTEAIVDVARAGMGVAILSEWVLRPHLGRDDLRVKRLASGPLRRPWRLAWRREVGDVALRLLAALESTAPRAGLGGRALGPGVTDV